MREHFGDGAKIERLMMIDNTATAFKASSADSDGLWDSCEGTLFEFITDCLKYRIRIGTYHRRVNLGEIMNVFTEFSEICADVPDMTVHMCMDKQERFYVVASYNCRHPKGLIGKYGSCPYLLW